MKHTLLAGALSLTVALALPALAQTPETTNAQSPPAAAPAAPTPPAEGGRSSDHGGWGMGGGRMMRGMMMHRMMMRADPQQRCIDRLARRAARYAYIEVELGLTAQQRPLWDKVQSIAEAAQQKERALCDALKPAGEASALERMDQAEQFLSVRLDALRSVKPAVTALYQALTPDQKQIFNRPFRRH